MKGEPAEHYFQASGARICWFEWGEDLGAEAPVILLVHATGFHGRCWDKVVALLPEDHRIIAVDQRGHGRSENTGLIQDWSLPPTDIGELIVSLDLKNIVGVGHSMGGHGITQIASRMPERFERLLLIDPVIMAPERYEETGMNRGSPKDFPVAKRRNEWTGWEEMFERFKDRHPYSLWKPEVLEDYCRYGLVPRAEGEGFELGCPPIVEASIYVSSAGRDIYDLVRSVSVPVTVLRAKQRDFNKAAVMDFAASPTWEGLAGEFPNGRDVYVPELSHFIPMQDPELAARYIVEG